METLPEVLHFDIFLYLSLSDLFQSVSLVCRDFNRLVKSHQFLETWAKEYLGLVNAVRMSERMIVPIIRNLMKNRGNKQFVEFIPVSTDAGADEDMEQFWFGQAFEVNERPWCTLENVRNANASAVLAETQTATEGYYWAMKQATNLIRRWLAAKGKRLSRKNEHIAIAIFNHVVTTFPLDALVIDEPDSEQLKATVRKIFLNLRPFSEGFRQMRRFPDNPSIHDRQFDIEGAESSNTFALIKYIDISRKGDFTCPVQTLMVFVSQTYIDILDQSLKFYNDITKYEDLSNLGQFVEGLAKSGPLKTLPGVEYCEFSKNTQLLQPVLWVNFSPEANLWEVSIELEKFVIGKYFFIKLIRPQDRRADRAWNHDNMNIDVSYVVPRGSVISINDNA